VSLPLIGNLEVVRVANLAIAMGWLLVDPCH